MVCCADHSRMGLADAVPYAAAAQAPSAVSGNVEGFSKVFWLRDILEYSTTRKLQRSPLSLAKSYA